MITEEKKIKEMDKRIKELEESNKELRSAVRSLQIAINWIWLQLWFNRNLHQIKELRFWNHEISIANLIKE